MKTKAQARFCAAKSARRLLAEGVERLDNATGDYCYLMTVIEDLDTYITEAQVDPNRARHHYEKTLWQVSGALRGYCAAIADCTAITGIPTGTDPEMLQRAVNTAMVVLDDGLA